MSELSRAIEALRAGGIAVYPLLGLAVIAMTVLLEHVYVLRTRLRLPAPLTRLIDTDNFKWQELDALLREVGGRGYAHALLGAIVANRRRPVWWIESRAAADTSLIERSLRSWLWILETIVTAAPLLGLLGTITGMIRAFNLFGTQSLVDPTGVTGGVAEALIATAIGLFIALFSLFGFNYLTQRHALFLDELERLGTRLIDRIRLEQEAAIDEAP